MGITIDEAIYCMKSYLPSDDYTHCTECKYYGCNDNNTCKSNEAHQKAIDTMRKYQKIEQILKDIPYGGDATVRRIQEVVEDAAN